MSISSVLKESISTFYSVQDLSLKIRPTLSTMAEMYQPIILHDVMPTDDCEASLCTGPS